MIGESHGHGAGMAQRETAPVAVELVEVGFSAGQGQEMPPPYAVRHLSLPSAVRSTTWRALEPTFFQRPLTFVKQHLPEVYSTSIFKQMFAYIFDSDLSVPVIAWLHGSTIVSGLTSSSSHVPDNKRRECSGCDTVTLLTRALCG